jgi:hypothetical protein
MSLKREMLGTFVAVGMVSLLQGTAMADRVYGSAKVTVPAQKALINPVKPGAPASVTPVNTTTSSPTVPVTGTVTSVGTFLPAEPVDILRSLQLEATGYAEIQCLPPHLTSADQVTQVLDSTSVLLVHMEALRRGYADLPATEQAKLLKDLRKRHASKETDLMLGFDLGYAELVYEHNKTGLFFLRKANDHFQDQFSNLAYGMAQAEADLTLENAKPDELTTRKMDVMYRLGDAVKIDAAKHQPGFWPTYVRVIEKLKPLAAYHSFSRRDFSLAYVPYGNSVVPLRPVATASSLSLTKPDALGANGLFTNPLNTNTCTPEAGTSESNAFFGNMLAQRTANFNGSTASIQFYPTADPHLYKVRVKGPAGVSTLTFDTFAMPNVVEDVDGDGVFEIVARQYQYDPFKPVIVYRYTPCGFVLDKKISESFQ